MQGRFCPTRFDSNAILVHPSNPTIPFFFHQINSMNYSQYQRCLDILFSTIARIATVNKVANSNSNVANFAGNASRSQHNYLISSTTSRFLRLGGTHGCMTACRLLWLIPLDSLCRFPSGASNGLTIFGPLVLEFDLDLLPVAEPDELSTLARTVSSPCWACACAVSSRSTCERRKEERCDRRLGELARKERMEAGREGGEGCVERSCSARNCSRKSTIRGSFMAESLYSWRLSLPSPLISRSSNIRCTNSQISNDRSSSSNTWDCSWREYYKC